MNQAKFTIEVRKTSARLYLLEKQIAFLQIHNNAIDNNMGDLVDFKPVLGVQQALEYG